MNIKTIPCPACGAENLENSRYCCMCGISIEEARNREEQSMKNGVVPLVRRSFHTKNGTKTIEVYCHDITTFPEDLDILTISAYAGSYVPTPRTVICALNNNRDISVRHLAEDPYMDLRHSAGCWLSEKIHSGKGEDREKPDDQPEIKGKIRRVGCVEMLNYRKRFDSYDSSQVLTSVAAYFRMLDLAATLGVKMETIALPLLGAGSQRISSNLVVIPLVSEAIAFLKRNPAAKKIIFINYTYEGAELLANTVKNNYRLAELIEKSPKTQQKKSSASFPSNETNGQSPYVFISYTTKGDTEAAELLCQTLEERGIPYWIAPHEIHSGSYAAQIVQAIEKSTHFICLISQNSMNSEHVLNEIDLAFQHLSDGIVILPYRLDDPESPLKPEFRYYLSRMQWNYGTPPPPRQRAREFVEHIFG